ncbi:hypothetical protein [Nitrobacter hamburgensis]|uniref:hypothetical protein n=1 Tax=Nitrobacter hamburgensis TaxID=912 RepID=UPI00030252CF|nr:hypothetical protein [Nitrobacter hamburgensis]
MSNQGIVVWDMFAAWVTQIVGQRKAIVVAMDWTDFDADDQTTLALNLASNHGRATPLLWLTVLKDELKDSRNDFEDLCLARLAESLPDGIDGSKPSLNLPPAVEVKQESPPECTRGITDRPR